MTVTAAQSVWLAQVALASRDLVIHGDEAGAPGIHETLRAAVTGSVHGALMSLSQKEVYNIIQRLADQVASSIIDVESPWWAVRPK